MDAVAIPSPIPDVTRSDPGISRGEMLAFGVLWLARLYAVHEIPAFNDPEVNASICRALGADHWRTPAAFAEAIELVSTENDPEGVAFNAVKLLEFARESADQFIGDDEETRLTVEAAAQWTTDPVYLEDEM